MIRFAMVTWPWREGWRRVEANVDVVRVNHAVIQIQNPQPLYPETLVFFVLHLYSDDAPRTERTTLYPRLCLLNWGG